MPLIPPRKPLASGNSSIDALMNFLGINNSDPTDAAMDLVAPLASIGKKAVKSIGKKGLDALSVAENDIKSLVPSVVFDGKLFVGKQGDIHSSVIEREIIPYVEKVLKRPYEIRADFEKMSSGFTPTTQPKKFLSRQEAEEAVRPLLKKRIDGN